MAVLQFTSEDNQPYPIEAKTIVRVRAMTPSERTLHAAETRIDQAFKSYVKETVSAAGDKIQAEIKTFDKLTVLGGLHVWFDAAKAKGPIPIPRYVAESGFGSSLEIGNKLQYVVESPQAVSLVIDRAKGTVLPIPPAPEFDADPDVLPKVQGWLAPQGQWDDDVPELMPPEGS